MLGSPYLSHSSSVWTGCSVLTMLQTVFLFECLCHMICIILLSARCDLFVVLIKEYSSPEPIPCIWGIILPPGNFFFFFWLMFLSLCTSSCNFTDFYFTSRKKQTEEVNLPLPNIFFVIFIFYWIWCTQHSSIPVVFHLHSCDFALEV